MRAIWPSVSACCFNIPPFLMFGACAFRTSAQCGRVFLLSITSKKCSNMKQVFCNWNGAHWVARVDGRTICGGGVEVRRMLYKMNYTPIFIY